MVQIRFMHDDPDKVREVVERVIAVVQASGVVHVGDPSEVPNRRGTGLRVFVEMTAAAPAVTVTASPQDPPSPPRTRTTPIALPSAGSPTLEGKATSS